MTTKVRDCLESNHEKGESQNEWILIAQGAEAKIYKGEIFGRTCIVKERFTKNYRHPSLDKTLSFQRLINEARAMVRARKYAVDSPVLYFVDRVSRRLFMECVEGLSLREFLDHEISKRISVEHQSSLENSNESFSCLLPTTTNESTFKALAKTIGSTLAKFHNSGYIHGDITPSNILLRSPNSYNINRETAKNESVYSVVLIDYGLSYASVMAEDRAVDLYVFERALSIYRTAFPDFEKSVLEEGYFPNVNKSEPTRVKLTEVRSRGRKRIMLG